MKIWDGDNMVILLKQPPEIIKCRECNCNIDYGRFKEFKICENCASELRDIFPSDGDECPICENEIKYIGNIEYESGHRCTGCDSEWWYD